jgi:hypothetical protein
MSRRVGRAMTSPLAIVLAGAGAAAGILVGGGIPLAVGLGAAAWAGRVVAAVPRGERREEVNPLSLRDPWRRFVQDALQAKEQFAKAVKGARSGPLRERLGQIGERVETGVEETWRVAQRGQELTDARRRIDSTEAVRELQELNAGGEPMSPALQQTVGALEAQLASASRMDAVIIDARDRLRLLNARLDEAVVRAIELSVQAGDVTDLAGLGDDVDSLVDEMEALRQGLEAVSGQPPTALSEGA